jgi:hypothetical protein
MRVTRCRLVATVLVLAVFLCFTASDVSCLNGVTDDCCGETDSGIPCADGPLCHCACAVASIMPVVMTLEFHTPYVGELHEVPIISTCPDVMTELDRPPRPC